MKARLPRWESRNQADITRMERWVNRKLDDKYYAMDLTEGDWTAGYAEYLIYDVIKKRDVEGLAALLEFPVLLKSPEVRLMIAQAILGIKRRGAPSRMSDHRAFLYMAAEHVGWVREIWTQHYGRWKRETEPFAVDIVVRRFNSFFGFKITVDELKAHINRHGVKRSR